MSKNILSPSSRSIKKEKLMSLAASALITTNTLQDAIFKSANFSSIATDAYGVIQIFNVGAERMLGYTAAEVVNKVTPAEISDPKELIARAKALSIELKTSITSGFDALVFKASHGIEDIYELTYIRKDGSRFPAVVSVTALRDAQNTIIGYLLIGTDNTTRKLAKEALLKAGALQDAIFKSANFSSIATDAYGVIQIFNVGAERMLGYTAAEVVNKVTPAEISDPKELIARAEALSIELETSITSGFDALVFKASRGIEDIYELTYIRKNGSHFPAVVSVTALRDAQNTIIGYLLIGTDNTARKQAEEALLKAGALQDAIFKSANFSSIATDAYGVIQIFNVGAERMLGYIAAEVVNKVTPAEISDTKELIARAKALSIELKTSITPGFDALVFKASRGIEDIYDLTYIRKDGSRFPAVVSVTALRDKQEKIIGYLLIGTDNTVRKEAQVRQKLAASVFTHAREGIMITDASGTIIEVNKTFSRITGFSQEEVIGHNVNLLKSTHHPLEFYLAMRSELDKKGHWYGEIWGQRKSGELYDAMIAISALKDDDGHVQNYVALFSDITFMKNHEKKLEHIAHYDALTGLANRVLLADRLEQAIILSKRSNQSLAVAFLDLDGFKAVNDQHGHEVGDELLIVLSQRMKVALRNGDTLARIGGDEFVAVLIGLDRPEECEPIINRLLLSVADPVTVGAHILHISVSIGVTLFPEDGSDADLLMRHADQAMYLAKQGGRNRYHLFDVDQDLSTKAKHDSIERIRYALTSREFVLYYQPKVNMKTGVVTGLEALIRWQHPERGLLLPADFLPLIEDHPISVTLGDWVLKTALSQMSQWRAAGFDIPISVNVGARQLQHVDFVVHLSELLATYPDIKHNHLELEVLETIAMEDISKVSQIMHACRTMGVRFALDDFGTGYSSLTYLKRLPVAVIKIDQSFVRDMLDDPENLAIVNGVIGLSKAFHREVIAEGVETVEVGMLLLSLGCELAQGYGIARPMPAIELPGWLETWRSDRAWTNPVIA